MATLSPRITVEEIVRVREACLEKLRQDHLYQARNSAKLRAVKTSTTYEEFKWETPKKEPINYRYLTNKFASRDIVDSAHLTPLSKGDKQKFKTKASLWNPIHH